MKLDVWASSDTFGKEKDNKIIKRKHSCPHVRSPQGKKQKAKQERGKEAKDRSPSP
jgi:hypothetical protein